MREGRREGGREGGNLPAGPPEVVEDDFPISFLKRSRGAPEEGEGGRKGGSGREGAVMFGWGGVWGVRMVRVRRREGGREGGRD